jgi:hypothetical protein
MIGVFAPFAPLFSKRIFQHVQVLLMGAILAPGKRQIVAVADGGYASLKKLLDRCRSLKKPIAFITHLRLDLRLDAAHYEPAAPRKPGQMGRPRLKGSRLANLSVVANDPKTAWIPITVSSWYGEGERAVELVSKRRRSGIARGCPRCRWAGC